MKFYKLNPKVRFDFCSCFAFTFRPFVGVFLTQSLPFYY